MPSNWIFQVGLDGNGADPYGLQFLTKSLGGSFRGVVVDGQAYACPAQGESGFPTQALGSAGDESPFGGGVFGIEHF